MSASTAAVLDNRYRASQAYESGTDEPRRGGIRPGRLVVQHHPRLRGHSGTPPDLVLKWGPMPHTATVDVVVHLHGFSARGAAMRLPRDIEPRSGLDLADPGHPGSIGRTSPTLLVLPRGHFFGGRTGRGYDFPALRRPGALTALVDDALHRFAAATGVRAARGRLILTAHSGGGSTLTAILRHTDPDEVHTFDALYGDPGPLVAWAERRRAAGTGALRVLFRPGEGTAGNSRRVGQAVGSASPRFRVEETAVPHEAIPRVYGWRLLADPAADLPGAWRPGAAHGAAQQQHVPSPVTAAPPLCAAIARVAVEQFRRWRPGGGVALTETAGAASPILREYYRVGVAATVTDAQMRSAVFQDSRPWSAVFISYVMRTAGAGPAFPYSAAHQTYIRATRQNRLRGDTANPFWAYRATEIAPRVGDVVCAARANSGATYDNIGESRYRATHCDVVTDVQPARIRVIGGNVSQTVGEKWLRTQPDGRLDLTGNQSQFFAIIRCRADGAAAPIQPSPAPAPARPSPGRPGLDARVRGVMDLLVNRYGYPVNAAAGIVGNLIAESGVQPNRIEGSAEATPMRARDFAGRLRDFTPDEVRDRDYGRRTGPRSPGIGLAQWTSRDRRRGLFEHTVRGRRLGSAILNDLAAQVDYLVTELRRDYRQLNALLISPRTSADQASDAVLLRFERPAAVLNKPPTDPGVQAVLVRRRRFAAQALQTYGDARRNWWGGGWR